MRCALGSRAGEEGVARHAGSGRRVDPEDRAIEQARLGGARPVLWLAQRAALGRRRRLVFRRLRQAGLRRDSSASGCRPPGVPRTVPSPRCRSSRRLRRSCRGSRRRRMSRAPIEWLGNCWHQSLMRTCSLAVQSDRRRRQAGQAARHDAAVGGGARAGVGQPSEVPSPGPRSAPLRRSARRTYRGRRRSCWSRSWGPRPARAGPGPRSCGPRCAGRRPPCTCWS